MVGSRYQPHSALRGAAIMPSEIALNLSVLELLQALNGKLSSECTRIREARLPPGLTFAAVLEAEVSAP